MEPESCVSRISSNKARKPAYGSCIHTYGKSVALVMGRLMASTPWTPCLKRDLRRPCCTAALTSAQLQLQGTLLGTRLADCRWLLLP